MSKQSEEELNAGIAIFERICSELGLTCAATSSFGFEPVRFDVSTGDKEVRIRLGYDFVCDLQGTREFQAALRAYLTGLARRFPNPILCEFATVSGSAVTIEIEFPFRRSTEGGTYEFVHVLTKSGIDTIVESNFSVHLTHTIASQIISREFVITEPIVVNAVRKFIDAKQAVFYTQGTHPTDLQIVTIGTADYDYKSKSFIYHRASAKQIEDFLKRKVYWLGFRRGNTATSVCIADPYDAVYLGLSQERLQQAAAILAAESVLQLDASGLYASSGSKLLQEARTLENEPAAFLAGPSSTRQSSTASVPPRVTDNAQFDVFISHATEDKAYVEPLAKALGDAGIRVWFDKTTLEWGDDLRAAIDRGLTNCRYGIVVFSKAFLQKKKWTEYELNSLFAREQAGKKLILPIWHGITHEDLIQYSPAFADRLAKISSTDSYADIVESLLVMLGRVDSGSRGDASAVQTSPTPAKLKPNAVAYARYETKGENALKAEAYVRPSIQRNGWFTFENSFGEEAYGTTEEIAQRFAAFDKSLTMKGYIRTHHGNSGERAFDL